MTLHTGAVFQDAMYVWGGNCGQKVYRSVDGANWAEAGSDALPMSLTGACGAVYDGKMWSTGGSYGHPKVFYTEDGVNWFEAGTDSLPRDLQYHNIWVHDGKLWVGGGRYMSTVMNMKVYYTTDGITWTEAGSNAFPVEAYDGGYCVHDNKMWYFCGGIFSDTADDDRVYYSHDGITWTQAGSHAFPVTCAGIRALVKGGRLYGAGGVVRLGGAQYRNVWQAPLVGEDHASTHQNGGVDEISVADLSGLLADAQTPLDHAHTDAAGDGGELWSWFQVVFTVEEDCEVVEGALRLYMPCTLTIDKVFIAVSTPPTGASLIVDVNKNGTTIFTTQGSRPQIAAGEYADESDTPDVTTLAAGDYLTMDVDQIGSGDAGANLTVHVRCKQYMHV